MKALTALALAMMAASVMAQSAAADKDPALMPGVKAPALKVHSWIKGTPVKEFKKGEIHVVEFWATWCGPCIDSIPHVTGLAKKYKNKIKVTGVSVWERPWDQAEPKVKEFVAKMGAKMDYTVAFDTKEGTMANTWMQAAEQNGIPAAFIVKDGVVQWVGHPMAMDEPLDQVVSGKFDLKAAKEQFMKEINESRARDKAFRELQELEGKYANDKAGTLARLDEIAKDPQMAGNALSLKLRLIAGDDPDKAKAEIDALIAKGEESASVAGMFAVQAVRQEKTKPVALYAAGKLVESAASWMPAYYAASAYSAAKMKPEAKAAFEKALGFAEKLTNEEEKKSICDFLKEQIKANS